MPGTITTTQLTDAERAELDAERAAPSDLVGTVIRWGILFAIVGAVLGAIGFGVGSLFAYPGGVIGLVVGVALGAAAGVAAIVGGMREARGDRRRLAEDLARGTVVEIRVTDAEVAEDGSGPDFSDHQLVVDLDESRVLLISRNMLFRDASIVEPDVHGPGVPPAEGCEDSLWNGLAPPYAFPTRSFVLRGLESSGRILSLRTDGEAIPVDREAGRVAVPFIGFRRAFMVTTRLR